MTAKAWGLISCLFVPLTGQTVVAPKVDCMYLCASPATVIFDTSLLLHVPNQRLFESIQETCRSEIDDEVWRSEYVRLNIIRIRLYRRSGESVTDGEVNRKLLHHFNIQ